MLKKLLPVSLYLLGLIFASCNSSYAYDPLSVPNNQVGVHILDTQEIDQAAKLVNSSGGDWGYITIPIRIDDRDSEKWTKFFQKAKLLHVIPILRISTYAIGDNWATPTPYDLVDFANFLNTMPWPVQNRYIILFNEVNRANEWGRKTDPAEYAALLINAKEIFKSRSADFYILSAGLDMSSPNSSSSIDALAYYRLMTQYFPDWYNSIDGISVHAYPNPGYSSSVYSTTRFGIKSYAHELNYLSSLGFNPKPIFISETGWPHDSPFYTAAFTQVWKTTPSIVAITPFLLYAGGEDFGRFSLLDSNLNPKGSYYEIYRLPKIAGAPVLASLIISLPVSKPAGSSTASSSRLILDQVRIFVSKILRPSKYQLLKISNFTIPVETAKTQNEIKQGLSGRLSPPDNTGMLFVFDSPERRTFWMKDMRFSLDFIWIRNRKIVGFTENVPPPTATKGVPQIVSPREDIDQVLEVPAGFIEQNQIKLGNDVYLVSEGR